MAYIGTTIREVLAQQERTEAWFARRVGYSPTYVWFLLRGQRRIRPEFVRRACIALNLPERALFITVPDEANDAAD